MNSQRSRRSILTAILTALILLVSLLWAGCSAFSDRFSEGGTWWKGNLHGHSYRSDGDEFPEMVADWYKSHGYNFESVTDHVTIENYKDQAKPTFVRAAASMSSATVAACEKRFGPGWVQLTERGGKRQITMRPYDEYRTRLEEPGKFLLMPGEEISANQPGYRVLHINVVNYRNLIPVSVESSFEKNLTSVMTSVTLQRETSGQAVYAQVNHPNFCAGPSVEEIMNVDGVRFFEVYNGTGITRDKGDPTPHPSVERFWDILLTRRLAELGKGPVYGTAIDDAHSYHLYDIKHANPGRGWVMVRAKELTPNAIIQAMEAGQFYASTGVSLRDIQSSTGRMRIRIAAEKGVTYHTQFIGTRRGYDPTHEPVMRGGRPVPTTHTYSPTIGVVLAESDSLTPTYKFRGDEIYVRARVVSSKAQKNPAYAGDHETAWVQPVVVAPPQAKAEAR